MANANRIIRLPEAMSISGLRRATIYKKMSSGEFPRQVHMSPRAVGWIESEVEAWRQARIAERDSKTAPAAEHRV